jgi:hypothetical protein
VREIERENGQGSRDLESLQHACCIRAVAFSHDDQLSTGKFHDRAVDPLIQEQRFLGIVDSAAHEPGRIRMRDKNIIRSGEAPAAGMFHRDSGCKSDFHAQIFPIIKTYHAPSPNLNTKNPKFWVGLYVILWHL